MATDPYDPLVQDMTPLNEVKYAARDYPTILDSLLRRLKILYVDIYNDYAATAEGIMFMELVAYAIAGLQWYLDRTASDVYLATSRTRSAASRIVEQIGYKMDPAAASSTTLTLTFPDGSPGPFTMGARWRYQGPEGLQFESYADVIVPAPLSPGATLSVDVRQGETRLLTYTSDGSKNQTYRLSNITTDRYLAEGSVQAWVDGSEWTENDFLEYDTTDQFEVSYLADPPVVRFGDGSAGNVPPSGAEVKIRFLIIDGEGGNVKADTIQSSIDTLIVLGDEVTFTVNNENRSSGGTDPEKIDKAKRIAPFSFAARGAAITEDDYEALSLSYTDPTYGSVALSYAFNPRAIYDDVLFNSYIDAVQLLLLANSTDSGALETAIDAAAALATVYLDDMNEKLGAVTGMEKLRTDLFAQVGTAKTYVDSAKGFSDVAVANAQSSYDAATAADSAISALEAYVTANTPPIPSTESTYILNALADMSVQVNQASSQAMTARMNAADASTALPSATTELSKAYDNLNAISKTWPEYNMYSLIQLLSTKVSEIRALFETPTTGLQDMADEMVGNAATLDTDVNAQLSLMHTRIGALFSEDCMSNYVQVPILSLDSDGNYIAPSVGLMAGLQTYLNSIKEVTQQVEVVDGSSILVPAQIEMSLKVLEAYVAAEVKSKIEATVVGLLKGRSFNTPLYLSDLYRVVKAASNGIDYVNIEITGPTLVPSVIDSKGNLVPAANQVIVLGSLTITLIRK